MCGKQFSSFSQSSTYHCYIIWPSNSTTRYKTVKLSTQKSYMIFRKGITLMCQNIELVQMPISWNWYYLIIKSQGSETDTMEDSWKHYATQKNQSQHTLQKFIYVKCLDRQIQRTQVGGCGLGMGNDSQWVQGFYFRWESRNGCPTLF